MLNRLSTITSNYNVTKWEKDRARTEKTLKKLCHYPHMFKGYWKQDVEFFREHMENESKKKKF